METAQPNQGLPKRRVRYQYVISTILTTRRHKSRIYEFAASDGWLKRAIRGLPYTMVTFLLGWWGLPFGIIFTPVALVHNLLGGEDVTFKEPETERTVEKFTNNRFKDFK